PHLVYPSLYGFAAGGAVAIVHALGWIDPPARAVLDAVLVARCVSALAGLATVALVGIAARRAYGGRAGLAACAFMAVLPMEVLQVHYVSCDALVATLATATLLASLALLESGRARSAVAAGLAGGLTTATKYTAAIALAGPAWAAIETAWRRGSVRVLLLLAAASGVAAFAGFSLGCPECVLRPEVMLQPLRVHYGRVVLLPASAGNNFIVPGLGWYARPWLFQAVAVFPWAMGWPLYATALLGVALALRRREPADRLLLASFAAGFAAMGFFEVTYPRYYMPLYPLLVVFAARFAACGLPRRIAPALCAVVFAYTLALSASQVARFSYDQQRAVVAWVQHAFAPRLARGIAPDVAFPAEWGGYTRIAQALSGAHLTARATRLGARLAEIEALQTGTAGYREVAAFRSRYLHQELYTAIDPGLQADLWQGEIGFTVYLR